MRVFTPLNATKTKRLKFNMEDVEVVQGSLNTRQLGKQATVKIKGNTYDVYGKSCGLPNCTCDAYIKQLNNEGN